MSAPIRDRGSWCKSMCMTTALGAVESMSADRGQLQEHDHGARRCGKHEHGGIALSAIPLDAHVSPVYATWGRVDCGL